MSPRAMLFSLNVAVAAAIVAVCAARMPYSSYLEPPPQMPSPYQAPARMSYTSLYDPTSYAPLSPQYEHASRTPYGPRYDSAAHTPFTLRYEPASRFPSLPSIPFFGGPDYSDYKWTTLAHNEAPTQYVQWKYGTDNDASGLTFGVECKGKSCEDRSAFATSAKGDAPFVGSHAVHTRWTSLGHSSQIFCPKDSFVTKVECKDAMCDRARLVCAPLTKKFRAIYTPRAVSTFDGVSRAYCPPGKYMDGFWCLKDCNTFYLTCTEVQHFRPA